MNLKQRLFLPLNLQFFADGESDNQAGNDGSSDVNNEKDEKSTSAETEKTTESKTVSLTQEELDALITKRLERDRKKYADYDEKAQRLAELEKAEEERKKAAMSEQERLQAEKEEAEKIAKEKEEAAETALNSANERIKKTEIRAIATSLNANDPNDVLALIDQSSVEIDDEGNVKGAKEAVEALKQSKPWLFKAPIGADASGGSNPQKNPSVSELKAKEQEYAELQQKAKKDKRLFGKLIELGNEITSLRSGK